MSAQDLTYREFHSGLLPGFDKDRIIGVRMPQLRRIAKDLSIQPPTAAEAAEGRIPWQVFFQEIETAHREASSPDRETPIPAYEEVLTAGLALAYAKLPLSERFLWIRRFVPMIDNWATCDTFCGTWKPKAVELPQVWDFLMQSYLTDLRGTIHQSNATDASSQCDATEYDLRYGVVMLLNHFVQNEEYIDRILEICNEIDHPGYYVKMAVAWALSYAFIFFPDKTVALFQSPDNRLDDFTYNKSIQKACESFRISKEQKAFLRTLRR
ncbi:MAG: DNA alkylation repair protein [Firmicutes bacterium]|nr:DNA alkylation repair protein [Bacillota bacterium]